MKQIRMVLITFFLLLCLCSCNNPSDAVESDLAEIESDIPKNTVSESITPDVSAPIPSPTPSQTANIMYEANKDLRVVTSFVYDRDTYIVVENIGEQAVLNYRIAYINFDKNGFATTNDSDGYELGRADTANLIPGSKDIGGWYGATGAYAVATIVAVDYADGSTWESTSGQIEHWAEETKKKFSIETQKANVEALKDIGSKAEINEYATLTEFYLKHDNQFSNNHDLHFSVLNTSNQGITRVNLFILEFDENGFPVSVSPYDTYCINGHATGGTVNLAVGEHSSYSDNLFAKGTTTQLKAVISYMEFQDGTTWDNPYLYEWIIGNANSY